MCRDFRLPLRELSLACLLAAAPLAGQVTETPETIRPGRFSLRVDAVTIGVDSEKLTPRRYTALGVAHTLFSLGVTDSLDFQAGVQLFRRETYQSGFGRTSESGLGDIDLRVKWTFWRSDDATAAAAVIPYVRLPSSSHLVGTDRAEYGVIVPWAMDLAAGFRSGAMFEWDVLRNDARNGYDSHWSASAFVRRDLGRTVALYGETSFAVSSASSSTFVGGIGGGATLRVSNGITWEYGVSRGVGGRATDWIHLVRFRWGF
jgi:hypothetical protein